MVTWGKKKNLTRLPRWVIKIYKQEGIMFSDKESSVVVLSQVVLLGIIGGIIILPSPPGA
jgi:hypothetical protein